MFVRTLSESQPSSFAASRSRSQPAAEVAQPIHSIVSAAEPLIASGLSRSSEAEPALLTLPLISLSRN